MSCVSHHYQPHLCLILSTLVSLGLAPSVLGASSALTSEASLSSENIPRKLYLFNYGYASQDRDNATELEPPLTKYGQLVPDKRTATDWKPYQIKHGYEAVIGQVFPDMRNDTHQKNSQTSKGKIRRHVHTAKQRVKPEVKNGEQSIPPLYQERGNTAHSETLFLQNRSSGFDSIGLRIYTAVHWENPLNSSIKHENLSRSRLNLSDLCENAPGYAEISLIINTSEVLRLLLSAVSLVFGLPGSVFILMTISTMQLKPSVFFISILAVADLIALFLEGFGLVINNGFHVFDPDGGFFMTLFTIKSFSHWLLAMVCLERFVSVQFPLKLRKIYTIKNQCIISVVCFSFLPLLELMERVFPHLSPESVLISQTAFTFLLPGIIILIFTPLTIYRLRQAGLRRQEMSPLQVRQYRLSSDMTRMMLYTCVCYVFLLLPLGLFTFITLLNSQFSDFFFYNKCSVETAKRVLFLDTVFAMINLNHSVNFYIYVTASSGFRKRFLCDV